MKSLFLLAILSVSSATNVQAQNVVTVFAEGRAQSRVAEHVVRNLARQRAFSVSRNKCERLRFTGEPLLIPGSGYDTASYRNRIWSAHFWAEFECSDDVPDPVVHFGEWSSEDGDRTYMLMQGRFSWWEAKNVCSEHQATLVDETISEDWQYLRGTTDVVRLMSTNNGCRGVCPVNSWLRDERDIENAYYMTNSRIFSVDRRGMDKATRYSAVCVF